MANRPRTTENVSVGRVVEQAKNGVFKKLAWASDIRTRKTSISRQPFLSFAIYSMSKNSSPTAVEYQNEPVRYPALQILDITAETSAIEQRYKNIVLNQVNKHCLRLAVIQGEYPWHYHPHSDELFLVVEGRLLIDLTDGRELCLEPKQCVTIPANTVHRTRAEIRTVNLLFEELAAETVFLETPPR
jgi:mannose-6-phosphate isomerase-like protein (cupin superfamily)